MASKLCTNYADSRWTYRSDRGAVPEHVHRTPLEVGTHEEQIVRGAMSESKFWTTGGFRICGVLRFGGDSRGESVERCRKSFLQLKRRSCEVCWAKVGARCRFWKTSRILKFCARTKSHRNKPGRKGDPPPWYWARTGVPVRHRLVHKLHSTQPGNQRLQNSRYSKR